MKINIESKPSKAIKTSIFNILPRNLKSFVVDNHDKFNML